MCAIYIVNELQMVGSILHVTHILYGNQSAVQKQTEKMHVYTRYSIAVS